MAKFKEQAKILEQVQLAPEIFRITLQTQQIAKEAVPGQFVSLYCHDGSRMLPRPISLCEIDQEQGVLKLVYRVAGKGTKEFSMMHKGERIEVVGPLGNGFPLQNKKAILVGGGIGIPPMLELAKQLPGEKTIVLGYRDSQMFLKEELEACGKVVIATEDGSVGTKGNVLDAIAAEGVTGDVLYACGPTPMLCALKQYAAEQNLEAWISLEEKMACGIGACLACVCKTKHEDEHSHVHNARVCKEGPVFRAEEVEL